MAAQPKANRLDLTGVFGLVAPLAATLGLFKATGSIERIQRDNPNGLFRAVALVLAAGTIVTIATFLSGEGERKNVKWVTTWVLFPLAAICTVVGFGIALKLVFKNASAESRPAITAALSDDQSKLTARVTAANLKTEDRLGLKVDLATLAPGHEIDDPHPFARGKSFPLERAYVGPDSDGKVDQKIVLSVTPGGKYTHLVIKAFTEERNRSCTEPKESLDPGTACTFIALDPKRSGK